MGQKIVEEYDNQVDKYLQDESAYNRETERLENSIAALEAEQKVVSSG
jgi:hypothetical protein